jgi:hypothetical protein
MASAGRIRLGARDAGSALTVTVEVGDAWRWRLAFALVRLACRIGGFRFAVAGGSSGGA